MTNCAEAQLAGPHRVRVWTLLCGMLALLVLVSGGVASAEGPSTPASIDDLLQIYGVASEPVDYVVVVDTSGSMSKKSAPIYPEVRSAYKAFVDAISDHDHLSLITFDAKATLRFSAQPKGDARATALAALPKEAHGSGTNIGDGIRIAIDQLGRADAHDVQIVLFLTDGEPTVKADYKALGKAAANATKGRQLRVLGASLGPDEKTGASLLETVFPGNTQVTRLPSDQLKAFFQDAIKRAQIANLYRPIRDEIDDGAVRVSVEPPELAGDMDFVITLTNDYGHLGAKVTVEKATVLDEQGNELPASLKDGRATIILTPGQQSQPLKVRVDTAVQPAPLRIGVEREQQYFAVELDAAVRVEPSDLITQSVGLKSKGKLSQAPQALAHRDVGIPYWLIAVYVIAALFALWLAVFIWRRFFALPPLWGYLREKDRADGSPGQVHRLRGKETVVGHGGKFTPSGTGNEAVRLFTRRGQFTRGKPTIFAEPKAGDVRITRAGRRERIGPRTIVTPGIQLHLGAASVTFLTHR